MQRPSQCTEERDRSITAGRWVSSAVESRCGRTLLWRSANRRLRLVLRDATSDRSIYFTVECEWVWDAARETLVGLLVIRQNERTRAIPVSCQIISCDEHMHDRRPSDRGHRRATESARVTRLLEHSAVRSCLTRRVWSTPNPSDAKVFASLNVSCVKPARSDHRYINEKSSLLCSRCYCLRERIINGSLNSATEGFQSIKLVIVRSNGNY